MALNKSAAVIGLGYVGLPLALLIDKNKHRVIGVEADSRKVQQINDKQSPIEDEDIATQLEASSLTATTRFEDIKSVKVIVVCVPTPVDGRCMPDLTPLISACKQVSENLGEGQLVIIESTINPGVCEDVVLPILEAGRRKCGIDFYLAHCPERINPGDIKWNVSNIPRVVGGHDEASLELAVEFYKSILDAQVKPMGSLKEAEAVKVVENSFRDINIAFVNELAMSFSKLEIDVVNVIDGAATKPFSFMAHYPGAGVGGHCIPVDPYYLIEYAKSQGFDHAFLKTARKINKAMPKFVVDQFVDNLQEANIESFGTKVLVLGLSYKPNVGDLRESPSLEIIKQLQAREFDVTAYDPHISDTVAGLDCEMATDLNEALNDTQAVILATAHDDFLDIEADDLFARGVKVLIDGRNCLDKASYQKSRLIYSGIGI